MNMDTSKITRVEVIDSTGRAYVDMRASGVTVQLQDDERTMKVFTKGQAFPLVSSDANDLREDLRQLDRAYDHLHDELERVYAALEEVADDKDGECEFSYAPGVADSLLVRLGRRKHWSDRK